MKYVESFQNPTFKYLKGLGKAKNRRHAEVFLMEGRPELDLAFKSGMEAIILGYCDDYIDAEQLKPWTSPLTEVLKLKKALFDDLTYQHVPGNAFAVFKCFKFKLSDIDPSMPLVIIEQLEKPGNLGAVLRTCDALGLKQVVLTNGQIDLFNPNVLRNSRGAVFGVRCVQSTNEEVWDYLQTNKIEVRAAALTSRAVDYREEAAFQGALLFGAESSGLSTFWLERIEQHVVIPMRGITDSLNLSVTVAILTSHYFQH